MGFRVVGLSFALIFGPVWGLFWLPGLVVYCSFGDLGGMGKNCGTKVKRGLRVYSYGGLRVNP